MPPLVIFLAKTPLVAKYDVSSVKAAGSGAAALSKETEKAFQERFHVEEMKQGMQGPWERSRLFKGSIIQYD